MRSQPVLLSAMMNLMPWRRRTDRPPMSPTAQPAPDNALLRIAAAREPGLVLVHALDGFLSAGQAGRKTLQGFAAIGCRDRLITEVLYERGKPPARGSCGRAFRP